MDGTQAAHLERSTVCINSASPSSHPTCYVPIYTNFPRSTVSSGERARRQNRRNSTTEDDEGHPEKRLQVNNRDEPVSGGQLSH